MAAPVVATRAVEQKTIPTSVTVAVVTVELGAAKAAPWVTMAAATTTTALTIAFEASTRRMALPARTMTLLIVSAMLVKASTMASKILPKMKPDGSV